MIIDNHLPKRIFAVFGISASRRERANKRLFGVSLVLLSLLLAQACTEAPQTSPEKPKIASTIFPLYDMAKNIVGDKFDVIQILPPGASPHTYELTPKQVKQLQGVSAVFSIGHGLDSWTDTLVETVPDVKRVVVDDGVRLKKLSSSEEDEEHEHAGAAHHHEGANPHYWLSIENGKIISQNIAREIIRIDPANEDYYRAGLETYLANLDNLRTSIEARINTLSDKKMVTFHDAWAYFAEEFGLEIVGTFEPFPGKQPTPRYLAELQDLARRNKVKAVFSEPQLSDQAIASFVQDIGLELYVLDPLGGIEGRDSYIKLLTYNADVIVEALRQ